MKFKTRDGTHLFYEDTGTGKPLVLIHGWPLSSAMWEYQLNELPERGVRCIAYDRRGFGRSDHPATGFDYDTLASDLNDLLEHLDLRDVTLAGFSMGGGEVVRYLSTYGSDRVARIALIAAVTPFMLKTSDNPDGIDKSVFEDIEAGLRTDRPNFLTGFTKTFFGFGWISAPISDAMLASNVELAMHASARATLGCAKAFAETDFRRDLEAISVPALVIHGDADKTVPFEASGKRTAKAISGSKLIVYSGAPHGLHYTERVRLNADLESWVAAGASGVRSAAE